MRIPNDEKLLAIYMRGFNDELDNKPLTENLSGFLLKAYNLGKSDAIVGDDVMSLDYQSNEEIIKRIRNK